MTPNGRTLHKVLMKGRQRVIWGSRAFLTVRLPATVLPIPRPSIDYCREWGEELGDGLWEKDLGDGTKEIRRIVRWTGGTLPESDSDEPTATVHFLVEEKSEWSDYTTFSWWEGTRHVVRDAPDDRYEKIEDKELSVEDIAAHRALHQWHAACFGYGAKNGTVLDAFLFAAGFAKTHYTAFSPDDRYLYLTFSVKWYQHRGARRFCAELKRAFRYAAEKNIDAKLCRRGCL